MTASCTNVYDGVLPVHGARDHVEDGEAEGGDDGGPGLALSAPDLGQLGVTDVDVALDCQDQSQPVRPSVEYLGQRDTSDQTVFSTLIGRTMSRLGSHWSRASWCFYASSLMP